MKVKRSGTILMAFLSIIVCLVALVGGTYALFTNTTAVTGHLVAGSLKIKLERNGLTKYSLDSTTGLHKKTVYSDADAYCDFTASTDKNVFDIGKNEKIAPGSWYEAKMQLSQVETNSVAFDYKIIIALSGSENDLASQLKVYVDGKELGYLSEFTSGSEKAEVFTGQMKLNDSAKSFTVKLEFEPRTDNNAVMQKGAKFDIIVEAVQAK